MEQKLKLQEFRVLYRTWKRGIPWFDHLLLGLLVWLEEKLIDVRVKVEVDEAIKRFRNRCLIVSLRFIRRLHQRRLQGSLRCV